MVLVRVWGVLATTTMVTTMVTTEKGVSPGLTSTSLSNTADEVPTI
jgi:hypothetical protein